MVNWVNWYSCRLLSISFSLSLPVSICRMGSNAVVLSDKYLEADTVDILPRMLHLFRSSYISKQDYSDLEVQESELERRILDSVYLIKNKRLRYELYSLTIYHAIAITVSRYFFSAPEIYVLFNCSSIPITSTSKTKPLPTVSTFSTLPQSNCPHKYVYYYQM